MSTIYGMECGECRLLKQRIAELEKRLSIATTNAVIGTENSEYFSCVSNRYREALEEGKKLADLICNSPPDTAIKGEIESRALEFAHLTIVIEAMKEVGK